MKICKSGFRSPQAEHTFYLIFIFLISLIPFNGYAQGELWGVMPYGGDHNIGVLYRMNEDGTGFNVKKHFLQDENGSKPSYTTLAEYNGKFYGVTANGGLANKGVIFSFDPATNVYSKAADFLGTSNGSMPFGKLVPGPDNKMYGMTKEGGANDKGTLFQFEPSNGSITTLKDLSNDDGWGVSGNLLLASNGKLYGLLFGGGPGFISGTIFEYDISNFTYTTKYTFDDQAQGFSPTGGLIEGSGSVLYGIARQGGEFDSGAIFAYNFATNTYTRKLSFSGSTWTNGSGFSALLNNKLYVIVPSNIGTTGNGAVMEYDPVGNSFTLIYSFPGGSTGGYPNNDVVVSGSKIYGTCLGNTSGAHASVLYEYDPASNQYAVKQTFTLAQGWGSLNGLLKASNGKLYGLNTGGGDNNTGTLFEYDLTNSAYTVKYNFDPAAKDGANPTGILTLADNGKLYGVTKQGGVYNNGIIFEYDPSTLQFTNKVSLQATSTGAGALAGLTLAKNGKLYGTASEGGSGGHGTIFEYDPATNVVTKKHDFDNNVTGSGPASSMTVHPNGKLYGTTVYGGSPAFSGVLFEFDPSTGSVTKKLNLLTATGSGVYGKMLLADNGKLYGTSTGGGASSEGVIFEYDADLNRFSTEVNLNATNGQQMYGGFTRGDDGKFYGLAAGGGANGTGTIIEYTPGTTDYTLRYEFPVAGSSDGLIPRTTLTRSVNGKFYGLTTFGGSSNEGVIFEFNTTGNVYTKKVDLSGSTGTTPDNGGMISLPLAQTIVFNALATRPMSPQTFDLPAVTDAGLPVTYASSDANVATVSGNTVTLTGVGTTTITASRAGGLFFSSAAPVQQTLEVTKGSQAITFDALVQKTIGDAVFDLPVSVDSQQPLTITSSNEQVATVSGKTVTIVGAGETTFTASQAGNTLYNAAADQQQTLTIVKKSQAITFTDFGPLVENQAPVQLTATASSNLAVTYSSSDINVATMSGSTLTIVGTGPVVIYADQPGNSTYQAAVTASVSLVVKRIQTITFNALPSKTVNSNSFLLNATTSSGLPVTYTNSNPAVATLIGNVVFMNAVGTTNITASAAGNATYADATPVVQELLVRNDQAITFPEFTGVSLTTAPFTIMASASSTLPLTFTSSNTAVATVSGSQLTIVGAGTTTITASQTGDNSYAPAELSRTLVIKANQTITFNAISAKTLGDPSFILSATASSALAVQFSTSSDKVTLSGSSVAIVKAGSVTITAGQPGNATFNAASSVDRTFCINPEKPTITLTGSNTETILLTSSATAGNQWFLNGTAIALATSSSYKPTVAGIYKVQVTVDHCASAFSTDQPIVVTGDIQEVATEDVQIYPNPVQDRLLINLPGRERVSTVHILRIDGVSMEELTTKKAQLEVNVLNYSSGLYLVKISHDGVIHYGKFIKQ